MPKPTPRRKPPNRALAALMRSALDAAGLTIEELGDRTGFGRQVAGRIVRGEVRRIAPEQANTLVVTLPLTMEQLLATSGYHMAVKGQQRLPQNLVEALLALPPDIQQSVARLARAAANGLPAQGGSAP
ncbi:MAG: helix-turn-helix domain-containing protein [Tepidiformaceae bacterium]